LSQNILQPNFQPNFPGNVLKLDSGLTLIHQELPNTNVVVADVWVRAGASYEPESWNGMAHFLEHMIFKGSENIAPGVFDFHVENRGGVSSAATSHDYAHFSLTTASQYLGETLPYLGEILLNPALSENEFIRERHVVLEEIRGCGDDPDWVGSQALNKIIYQLHPYGRPILGSKRLLMGYSTDQMRCFHSAYYQPENMTVVIVGGLGREEASNIVSRSFGNFPIRCLDVPFSPIPAQPTIAGIRRQEIKLPLLEQPRLIMGWTAPGVEDLRVGYGLDILSVLLAEGRTSRLVRDLREERQLVQTIYSSFSLQRSSSLFTISAILEPENLERVELLIRLHLEDLQKNGITEEELKRCQRVLCNDYAFGTETPSQLSGLYGYYQTIAHAELAVTYPQEIQSFNVKELQDIAQSFLLPHSYAVTVLKSQP
jgi:predicted Zn-dependent peptidase